MTSAGFFGRKHIYLFRVRYSSHYGCRISGSKEASAELCISFLSVQIEADMSINFSTEDTGGTYKVTSYEKIYIRVLI